MNGPCADCQERHDCCWSDCDRYASFKAKLDEYRKKKQAESVMAEFVVNGVQKVKRIRNKK